ncbi:hypothetical protein [Azospirillum agricola]|uniref:hypothetical protein n=1 Tax=Azospirillum agricola TaxID=1720247 RepID=UPI000A0F3202|nr:hypothetical protein [Azospirillum agricola]SMH61560.1 hypothetical protein SAMN02982994_5902 [Azospirillum lipoferum]
MPPLKAATIAVIAVLATGGARAQTASSPMDHAAHHALGSGPAGAVPTRPGQDAFGAIQEIIGILEADPATDWSMVDIEALRRHLADMNDVTLNARVTATPLEGGARYDAVGEGRTLEAIQRMVPAHVREINGANGWTVRAEPLPNGIRLTVTADLAQTARIRGLGFIGIMAQGSHHQTHHLAMATGKTNH